MKKIQSLFIISVILLTASCSSTYKAGSSNADDVYYSTKDVKSDQGKVQQPVQQTPPPSDYSTANNNSQQDNSGNQQQDNSADYNKSPQQNSDYSNSGQSRDGNGNTYVTNNYYNDDDYYDYTYSARLRRFYTPAYGYGYYDPFYTNLYWYDYNPFSWGVSTTALRLS